MKKKWKTLIVLASMALTAIAVAVFLEFNKNEAQEMKVVKTNYDVIVVGGEPEGVSAAISAARNGSNVLLIEERDGLGGLMTYGDLNYLDIPQNKNGDVTSKGIYKEFTKEIGGSHVTTIDVDEAKEVFSKMIQKERNITLKLNTHVKEVKTEKGKITGILLKDGVEYTASKYIDTTANADVAAKAGVGFTVGQQDIGVDRKMAVTLMIHLKDVDWKKVKKAGKEGVLGGAEVTNRAAWGFSNILDEYKETQPNTQVRGLNVGRTEDEEIYINALQIFNVDGLDAESKRLAIEEGKKETDSFVSWLKVNLPGFENAKVVKYPSELYVRETRHINSLYRLTIADVWESAEKYDTIAYGSYPVDVQAMEKGNFGNVITSANQYAIPFRSILPVEIDNLMVASKASGYDSLAAGSARVIPTGMAVAEAAGYIASYAIQEEKQLKDLVQERDSILEIQEGLKKQGMYLKHIDEDYKFPYQDDSIYPSLKILYSYEMIAGGYENNFHLEKPIGELTFTRLMRNNYEKLQPKVYKEKEELFKELENELAANNDLTLPKLKELYKKITGNELTLENEEKIKKLTRREVYPVLANEMKKHVATYKINNEN